MNIAMILAGGIGTRVGADRPKQFVEVLGKPVLAYTIEIFQQNKEIDFIQVICHEKWINYCRMMIKKYNLTKVKWIIIGGKTFQESVMNGVFHMRLLAEKGEISFSDFVFIQYGGAPFTSQKIVSDVIRVAHKKGNAVSATPCFQLISTKDEEGVSKHWVDRDKHIQIACPYGFKLSYLLSVYERAKQQNLLTTIEPHTTSLIYALGEELYLAYGDQTNIKITMKEDINLFEGYLLMKKRHDGLNTDLHNNI